MSDKAATDMQINKNEREKKKTFFFRRKVRNNKKILKNEKNEYNATS